MNRFLLRYGVKPYANALAFYGAVGFLPFEEHSGLDWPGPTLIVVRPL